MWALHKEQAESFYFGDPLGEMPLVNSVFEMKNKAAPEQARTLLRINNDDRKKSDSASSVTPRVERHH
jgi:hypothetical protein